MRTDKNVASFLVVALASCSLIGTHPPPEHRRPGDKLTCETDYFWPIVDTVFAAGGVGLGAYWYSTVSDRPDVWSSPAWALPLTMIVAYGFSAWIGYTRVSACREAARAPATP